jgi:hypothetical protein
MNFLEQAREFRVQLADLSRTRSGQVLRGTLRRRGEGTAGLDLRDWVGGSKR